MRSMKYNNNNNSKLLRCARMGVLVGFFFWGSNTWANLYNELTDGKMLICNGVVVSIGNMEFDGEMYRGAFVAQISAKIYLNELNDKEIVVELDSFKSLKTSGYGDSFNLTIPSRSAIDLNRLSKALTESNFSDSDKTGDATALGTMELAIQSLAFAKLHAQEAKELRAENSSVSLQLERRSDSLFVRNRDDSIKSVSVLSYEDDEKALADSILWAMGLQDLSAVELALRTYTEDASARLLQILLIEISVAKAEDL